MAGTRKNEGSDVIFEGVVIPKGTRSARLAEKGITNEDEMGNFLTAVFADTLNGKITLPKPTSGIDAASRVRNDVEQKLRRGLPIGIQGKGTVKRTRERERESDSESKIQES